MNIEISEGSINNIISFIKMYFIIFFTFYIGIKIVNNQKRKKQIIIVLILFFITLISEYIRIVSDLLNCIICSILLLSIMFTKYNEGKIGHSIIITTLSMAINYGLFFISSAISFFIGIILNIVNDYLMMIIILSIYCILTHLILKLKRIQKGIVIFNNNTSNESFDIIILNVSVIILLSVIVFENYKEVITGKIGIAMSIFIFVMFLSIYESLQLYYKQKLLVQELNETKEELENKKKEIEKLEQENLNFSKTSHSLNHKQKILEHKINELIQKNEIAEEMQIKDKVEKLSKELYKEKETVEITKTGVPEIDDILSYMQEECIKNKIEFNIQIIGNIFYMTNNIISKEDLQILLADHIKDAIIAINHCDNINRSILVKLGKITDSYGLYIYDSGIEFEQETLEKLGKVPITTHSEEGGTGMGFMNTFDTLRKYKASLIIEQYGSPSIDNYTKVIMIKFDKKENFKVI